MPLSRTLMAISLSVLALGSFGRASQAQAQPAERLSSPTRSTPIPASPTVARPGATQPATGASAANPGGSGAGQALPSTQAGLVTIESDRQQADNTTGIVTATGNVRIVYPDRKVLATSRQAQYFSREARVVLSGDVQVVQENGNRLLAEQVVYDVSQERVEARPFPGAQVLSIVRLKRSGGSSGTATDPQMQASPVLPAP